MNNEFRNQITMTYMDGSKELVIINEKYISYAKFFEDMTVYEAFKNSWCPFRAIKNIIDMNALAIEIGMRF